jgi:hypothetical protein
MYASCNTKNETAEPAINQEHNSKAEQREHPVQQEVPPPVSYTYKKVSNTRYNFTFEIPENWIATDKSNNGDGFYVDANDVNVDIRIYGESLTGIADVDNNVSCDAVANFPFADGTVGTKCTSSGLLYFIYTLKKKRVTLYINAPIDWRKKNINAIQHISESISMKTPA